MNAEDSSDARHLIELRDASIGALHRPGVIVLERVNWTVDRDQFWLVAGHHGSGKTDLLMTLAGLIAPASGSCCLLGEPMPIFEESRLQARLKVSLLFNGGQLLSHLTLGQNITLPLRYHYDLDESGAYERAAAVIEALELTSILEEVPGKMGREWLLRVGLARALVLRPELILMDDPLAGLDTRHVAWWLRFVRDLHRGSTGIVDSAMAVVVASDSLAPWRGVATHCAVLEDRTLSPIGCLEDQAVSEHPRLREYRRHDRWGFDPSA